MVNLELQDDGSANATQRRTLSKSWLARSAWPLVCGWYPEDRLAVAPSCRQNSVQNFDTNWGPLSETTSTGKPWMRKTWSKTIVAVSLAEGNLGRGIKWVAFENLSTTVRTTVLPSERGKPVTKSIAMCDQGREGTDSGWSSPAGGRLAPLPAAQMGQADTNRRASLTMDGHQNRCLISLWVRVAPGWQARLEEWPHCRTLVRTDSGTNSRLSGHPAGTVMSRSTSRTLDSTPQVTTATTRSCWRIATGGVGLAVASKIRDSASGLPFLEPGR